MTMRMIDPYKDLRPRSTGQIVGGYTDASGAVRNDWNDLTTNARSIHGAGVLACNVVGSNGNQFTGSDTVERFYPVDLQPGYRKGRLIIRLWPYGALGVTESIQIRLYRNGSHQTLRSYYVAGLPGPNGGTPLIVSPSSGPVIDFYDFDLDKPIRARFNDLERGYISIQRVFGVLNPAAVSNAYGVHALQLKQYL